ncbi:MAG TPA: histidine kinase [Bacteroidia bacterium]|nr:histidine kinase [Bacteroidia bacterium]
MTVKPLSPAMCFKFCCAALALIFFPRGEVQSQNYPLKHYTVDDGLTSNTVYDAIQDKRGFIWFATSAGASRFDGKNFERFTVDNGLSDNEVLKIRKDLSGRLWLLPFNGTVTIIDNDSIYNGLTHPLLKQLGPGFFYNHIYSDSAGTVWLSNLRNIYCRIHFPDSIDFTGMDSSLLFSTRSGNLLMFIKTKGITFISSQQGNQSHPELKKINRWCYYGDSLFVGLTDSAIITLDKSNNLKFFPVDIPNLRDAIEVYCDDELGIWITSEKNGVYYYENTNNGYRFYDSFLKGEYVTSTLRDNESNVWFTVHGNGVFMLASNFKTVKSFSVENGLQENEVYSVAVDSRGRIWAGHKYGMVDVIDNGKVLHFKLREKSRTVGRVLKIAEHPSGYMLISSDVGFFILNMNNPENNIREIYFNTLSSEVTKNAAVKGFSIQRNGDVYVVCHETIHYLNSSDLDVQTNPAPRISLPSKRYYAACSDYEGNLWYADFEGLMLLKNNEQISYKEKHPLLKQRIVDLCLAGKKIMVSILGYGLVVIENEKIIRHITTNDGLLSNHCGKMSESGSAVFVCTNKGLNIIKFNQQDELEIQQLTVANGLLSSQVNDVYVFGKIIYAATLNGISEINFEQELNKQSNIPRIYFSKITWQGKSIISVNTPRISYENKYLRFDFISPFFTFPEGVAYQYKLNNENWIETQNTSLEFNSLSPSDYLLQVRARHLHSAWSAPVQYSFSILPPFYRTWWFYLLVFSVVLIFGFVFYNLRIKTIKTEQAVKLQYEQQINRLQNQSLQAMMNPHFVFNSLNAIKQQINSGNTVNATNYLSRFARLLRMNLQTVNEDFIPLKEELERIRLYFEIEKIRLEDKLNYSIEVAPGLSADDVLIPSMIIQPFLENSIWHGIMPKETNGFVKLTVDSTDEQLTIKIEDDGVGINDSREMKKEFSDTKHYGIKLTKERLAFIQKKSNQNVILEITDKSKFGESGTLVTIILPLVSYK